MSDIDRIFSRFGGKKPESSDKRELLNIPRKGSALGSRVVEVVHVRSGGAPTGKGQPRRLTFSDRSETWERGFPARPPTLVPDAIEPAVPEAAEPVTHMMPMWTPTADVAEATPAGDVDEPAEAIGAPHSRKARSPSRRVADPFDALDDGANCIRCGYAVEPSREKRGLLTCAACG